MTIRSNAEKVASEVLASLAASPSDDQTKQAVQTIGHIGGQLGNVLRSHVRRLQHAKDISKRPFALAIDRLGQGSVGFDSDLTSDHKSAGAWRNLAAVGVVAARRRQRGWIEVAVHLNSLKPS